MNNDPTISVMVCHDCCCGTTRKHPAVDHAGQRAILLGLADNDVRVRIVYCLGVCERSNVVLVRDLRRPRGDRDTWVGEVTTPAQTDAIAEWVNTRRADVPEIIASKVFDYQDP